MLNYTVHAMESMTEILGDAMEAMICSASAYLSAAVRMEVSSGRVMVDITDFMR